MKGWGTAPSHGCYGGLVDACTLRNLLLTAIHHHFNWSPAMFRKEIRFENLRKKVALGGIIHDIQQRALILSCLFESYL